MRPTTFVKICLRLWLLQAGEQLYSNFSIVTGNKETSKLKHKHFSKVYVRNLRLIIRTYVDSKVTHSSSRGELNTEKSEDLSGLPDLIDCNNNIDNE